jgi:hypothetical protein
MGNSSNSNAFLGKLVGNKIYLEANLGLLSVSGPGWGYSIFGNTLLDNTVHNPTVPYFEIKTYVQYGVVGGLAFDFMDELLDVGATFKMVSRRGVGKTVHIVDFLDDDFSKNIEKEFDAKTLFSPDVGAIYHLDQLYNLQTKVAFVMKNVGGMDFGSSGKIPMTFDMGVSTESELVGFDIIMALDYVDITGKTTRKKSFSRNLKMGVEVGVFKRTNGHHALSFRVGRNGPYSTMGFTLNPPYIPIKIDYANWSEEVGLVGGEIEDKRQSVQLAFNF